jgi:hypothetical protein
MERARVKRYMKIFTVIYILLTVSLLLFNSAISALIQSTILIIIMAIFLISLDYSRTGKLSLEALDVRQKNYIQVKGNAEDVFLKGLIF